MSEMKNGGYPSIESGPEIGMGLDTEIVDRAKNITRIDMT